MRIGRRRRRCSADGFKCRRTGSLAVTRLTWTQGSSQQDSDLIWSEEIVYGAGHLLEDRDLVYVRLAIEELAPSGQQAAAHRGVECALPGLEDKRRGPAHFCNHWVHLHRLSLGPLKLRNTLVNFI